MSKIQIELPTGEVKEVEPSELPVWQNLIPGTLPIFDLSQFMAEGYTFDQIMSEVAE